MDDTVISPSVLSVRSSSSSSGIPVDSMSSEVEEGEMLVVGSTVNLNGGGDDNDDEESRMDDTSVGLSVTHGHESLTPRSDRIFCRGAR